ncbi:MAG: hypothetical protein GXY76_20740 [Chloroflexi bacterium]|nr:hypothetical protein [Chloroflexota bacterium]
MIAQIGYNNASLFPQQQKALAAQPNEPTAMTMGRHAGNVISVYQGVIEMTTGVGMVGGGVVVSGTGVGVAAGVPAVSAGAVVATNGAVIAGTAVSQEAGLLMESRSRSSRSSARPNWENLDKPLQKWGKQVSKWSLKDQQDQLKRLTNTLADHESMYADSLARGEFSEEVDTLRKKVEFLSDLIQSRTK